MTFGEKLKAARKQKRLTQKELASMIHAAHNSISNWENDQNKPDPDTIQNLCWALDVTPNYFFLDAPAQFDGTTAPPAQAALHAVSPGISPAAQQVALAYDQADPAVQFSVRKLLDVPEQAPEAWRQYVGTPIAARDGGVRPANEKQARHLQCLAEDLRRRKQAEKDGEDV